MNLEPDAGARVTHQPLPWFALQARTRAESNVATRLQAQGYELFLPMYETRRRWSDRTRTVQLPLFPGYLFCRLDVRDRLPILMTPGVIQIVGIGRSPVAVSETEIAAVRTIVKSGLTRHPWPFLQVGGRVRVEYGPLRGLEGILQSFKGHQRLVVSITILQRSVALEIDGAWVGAVRPQSGVAADALTACPLMGPATA